MQKIVQTRHRQSQPSFEKREISTNKEIKMNMQIIFLALVLLILMMKVFASQVKMANIDPEYLMLNDSENDTVN